MRKILVIFFVLLCTPLSADFKPKKAWTNIKIGEMNLQDVTDFNNDFTDLLNACRDEGLISSEAAKTLYDNSINQAECLQSISDQTVNALWWATCLESERTWFTSLYFLYLMRDNL